MKRYNVQDTINCALWEEYHYAFEDLRQNASVPEALRDRVRRRLLIDLHNEITPRVSFLIHRFMKDEAR